MQTIHGIHTLGDVDLTIPQDSTRNQAQQIVDALNAQNNRVFKVTVISTVIVGFAALLNSYRMFRQLRRDEELFRRHASQR
jgi:hypothetical protein